MVIITREQAICIFYCEPHNKDNIHKFSKIIDDLQNVEICYDEDPRRPFLCSLKSLQLAPSRYHQYPAVLEEKSSGNPWINHFHEEGLFYKKKKDFLEIKCYFERWYNLLLPSNIFNFSWFAKTSSRSMMLIALVCGKLSMIIFLMLVLFLEWEEKVRLLYYDNIFHLLDKVF
jgi:hypothetical protein